jgi:hypothetical protein
MELVEYLTSTEVTLELSNARPHFVDGWRVFGTADGHTLYAEVSTKDPLHGRSSFTQTSLDHFPAKLRQSIEELIAMERGLACLAAGAAKPRSTGNSLSRLMTIDTDLHRVYLHPAYTAPSPV